MKRRRGEEDPGCKPLAELAPGCAFNPYRLFHSWSLHQALARDRRLSSAARWVWVILAGIVYGDGYTRLSEREMAWRTGLSMRQTRRILYRLVKLHLAHRTMIQGYTSQVWLIYGPIFAGCSPLPLAGSGQTPRTEKARGLATDGQGIRRVSREYSGSTGVTRLNTTSNSSVVEERNGFPGERRRPGEAQGEVPITESVFTLRINQSLERSWRTWSQPERRSRTAALTQLLTEANHFRQLTNDNNAAIGRQARLEVAKRLRKLDELGGMAFDGNRRVFP